MKITGSSIIGKLPEATAFEPAIGTMPRAAKGAVIPPPALDGVLKAVADIISGWPGVITTAHWGPFRPTRVDGVDFYVGEEELGHIHLDGSAHIASSPTLGGRLIAEGLAKPLVYVSGWVEERVQQIGPDAAVHLFRSNYDRLYSAASTKS